MAKYGWLIAMVLLSALPGCATTPAAQPNAAQHTAAQLPQLPTVEEMTDPDKFSAWFARVLSDRYQDAKIAVKSKLTLSAERATDKGGDGIEIHLDRFFRTCGNDPNNRQRCYDIVASYLPNVFPSNVGSPVTRDTIVAVIRTKDYLDAANKRSDSSDSDNWIVARPFVGPLWVIYAYDNSQSTGLMTVRQFKELKLNKDELDVLAVKNLERLLGPMGKDKIKIRGNAIQVINRGNLYEASRLLLYEQWQELAQMQDDPLLVSIPARDVLVYTTANRAMAGAALRDLDFRIARRVDFPISQVVLRWTKTGWVEEKISR